MKWEEEKTLRLNCCIIFTKFLGKKIKSACAFQPGETRTATEKSGSGNGKFQIRTENPENPAKPLIWFIILWHGSFCSHYTATIGRKKKKKET